MPGVIGHSHQGSSKQCLALGWMLQMVSFLYVSLHCIKICLILFDFCSVLVGCVISSYCWPVDTLKSFSVVQFTFSLDLCSLIESFKVTEHLAYSSFSLLRFHLLAVHHIYCSCQQMTDMQWPVW